MNDSFSLDIQDDKDNGNIRKHIVNHHSRGNDDELFDCKEKSYSSQWFPLLACLLDEAYEQEHNEYSDQTSWWVVDWWRLKKNDKYQIIDDEMRNEKIEKIVNKIEKLYYVDRMSLGMIWKEYSIEWYEWKKVYLW